MVKKEDIRKRILDIRQTLSLYEVARNSKIVIDRLLATKEYHFYDCIYTYVGFGGEVSTQLLIETALNEGKKVACPKIAYGEMNFYYINHMEDLEPGHFGVMEPSTGSIAESYEALVVIPGVAFDLKRNRVGFGKGYYDKYLEKHKSYATIALAFDFQITESVVSEPFDIKPQFLITETRIF